jgi:hypothetical protein
MCNDYCWNLPPGITESDMEEVGVVESRLEGGE